MHPFFGGIVILAFLLFVNQNGWKGIGALRRKKKGS